MNGGIDRSAFDTLCGRLRYVGGDYSDPATFAARKRELDGRQKAAYYLAIPPVLSGTVVGQLAKSGCAQFSKRELWKPMKLDLFDDAEAVAGAAAASIAADARTAVSARGRFLMAVSGGRTPWMMMRALAGEDVPWSGVYVLQVDERVAPPGDTDRNLTHLLESLLQHAPLAAEQVVAMPVEEPDLGAAAAKYERLLREIAGSPPVLDLVHLGLGADGHTASLVPGDPVVYVSDRDVAVTEEYQGRRRMTLTLPILNRARRVLWVVTGPEKAPMLRRLCDGDTSIPAGRIRREQALVMADREALSETERSQ